VQTYSDQFPTILVFSFQNLITLELQRLREEMSDSK
jgi:hypothetical protein